MRGRRRSHRRHAPHGASSILERDPVVSRLVAQCLCAASRVNPTCGVKPGDDRGESCGKNPDVASLHPGYALTGEPKSDYDRMATLFAPTMVLVASGTEIGPIETLFSGERSLRNLIPGMVTTSGTIHVVELLVFKGDEKRAGKRFQSIERRMSSPRIRSSAS